MSGICEIFPEDPSCAVEEVEPEVVEEVVEEAEGEVEEEVAEEGEGEEEADAEPEMKVDNSEAAAKAVADWSSLKDMSSMADMNPMMANLSMAATTTIWMLHGALEAFRYRSKSTFYDLSEIDGGTNWYKI